MTVGGCRNECVCPCLKNEATWLKSEIVRLRAELRDKQRIIERLMENIPTRRAPENVE